MFKEAYAEKANDKDFTLKGMRVVFATLQEPDEFKEKAKYWIDQLSKKP